MSYLSQPPSSRSVHCQQATGEGGETGAAGGAGARPDSSSGLLAGCGRMKDRPMREAALWASRGVVH